MHWFLLIPQASSVSPVFCWPGVLAPYPPKPVSATGHVVCKSLPFYSTPSFRRFFRTSTLFQTNHNKHTIQLPALNLVSYCFATYFDMSQVLRTLLKKETSDLSCGVQIGDHVPVASKQSLNWLICLPRITTWKHHARLSVTKSQVTL